MDFFGIGNAMRGMADMYFRGARGSGRTTALLEGLKDGDRLVCPTDQQARRMRQLCMERNLKVDCVSVPSRSPQRLLERGTPEGRMIFDHTWVEEFYKEALDDATRQIDHWQRELSGWGEAHEQTRLAAKEMARWRF